MAEITRAVRNRRNRGRGKALERKVAKTLGWIRVPYSGSSDVYGRGDVVPVLDPTKCDWVLEAKSKTAQNFSIEAGWMEGIFGHRLVQIPKLMKGGFGHEEIERGIGIALALNGCSEVWIAVPVKSLTNAPDTYKGYGSIPCRIYAPATIVIQREDLLRVESGITLLKIADDRTNGQMGRLPQPCPPWFKFWWPIVMVRLDVFAKTIGR